MQTSQTIIWEQRKASTDTVNATATVTNDLGNKGTAANVANADLVVDVYVEATTVAPLFSNTHIHQWIRRGMK